jgi:hypothetical protein
LPENLIAEPGTFSAEIGTEKPESEAVNAFDSGFSIYEERR